MTLTKWAAVFGLSVSSLCVAVQASAQVKPAGGGKYDFHAKWTPGQTTSYKLATRAQAQGHTNSMPMTLKIHVDSVKADVATVTVSISGVPGQAPKPVVAQIDSKGNVRSGAREAAGIGGTLPKKPIKPGETWMGAAMGGLPVQAKFSFVGMESKLGKKVAHIRISFSGTVQGTSFSGGGDQYLLASDGQLFSSQATVKTNAQGQSMSISISVVRQ